MSRSSRLLFVCFLALLGFVLIVKALTVYTDFLWFGELNQSAVIRTSAPVGIVSIFGARFSAVPPHIFSSRHYIGYRRYQ